MTIGDPDSASRYKLSTKIVGSSVSASLLGQDGDRVWLLIGDTPFAVGVADGAFVADPDALQAANPELKDQLPSEARHYGFDRGLVVRTADARQWVVRGAGAKVEAYVPTPQPSAYPEGRLKSNGMRDTVPIYPLGEIPARLVQLDGQWIGLYSDAEAEDAADDAWGDNLLYPYSIADEGALARRTFRRVQVVEARNFDERFERIGELAPIAGAPTYLKGRFLKDLTTGLPGRPLVLADPPGVLVWHSTRMDDAGRLALARLDASLKEQWKTELPLSETSTMNPVRFWNVGAHVVAVGNLHSEEGGIHRRTPHLVSVALADGTTRAWNLEAAAAVE